MRVLIADDHTMVHESLVGLLQAEQTRNAERTPEDPYGSLSAREREVFHLIAGGPTTREIARKLDISVKTAENHRGRVLDKLDVRNTAGLVRYALRRGLLD